MDKKRVIIVGGGFSGAYIARHLEKDFNVVLIDNKEYFEFTPSVLRTIIDPKHAEKIQVLHKKYLKKAKFLSSEVTKITPKWIVVEGVNVPYKYLVIATGSRYKEIFKEEGMVLPLRVRELVQKHKDLEEASKVLLIGGGIVGVELAAEIITKYPQKEVTLIHSKERLMERSSLKASKYAEKFLTKKGVKIIFNERVEKKNGKTFTTNKGNEIHADLAFSCTGIISNGEALKEGIPEAVNERGQAIVNEFLQLKDYPNIFAAGDVTSVDEEKTAHSSEHHAMIIIKNIKNLEKGKPLKKYWPGKRLMVISLGKYNGIMTYGNFAFTGLIPALMKWLVEVKTMIHYR